MLAFAWRQIRRQPWRFAASAGSVASSVALVLVIAGLYRGLLDALVRWPQSLPGDVVVAEAGGSATLLHVSSQVPAAVEAAVRATPGAAGVEPLFARLAWIERDGRQAIVFLVGLGRGTVFGRPVRIVAGRKKPRLNEIVVDRVLAHDLRIGVGDTLQLGDATLRVAGIADGGNALLATYGFVHRAALALAGTARPSFLFVRATPDTTPALLAERLRAVPGARVLTRAEFEAANQGLARQLLLPLIAITATIAAAVSGGVVALTLYTSAMERRADYGLLAALGVPSRWVASSVAAQAGLVGVAGVGLGLLESAVLVTFIPWLEPRFEAALAPELVLAVAIGAVATAVVAARLPLRTIRRFDPAEVFRV